MNLELYVAPEVEALEVEVEAGFDMSEPQIGGGGLE